LREGTIVPKVALVGEAVADESKLALLDVLFNRVEKLFNRLRSWFQEFVVRVRTSSLEI
jgi:hypothetical protein